VIHDLIKNIIRPIFGRSRWSPFEKKKSFTFKLTIFQKPPNLPSKNEVGVSHFIGRTLKKQKKQLAVLPYAQRFYIIIMNLFFDFLRNRFYEKGTNYE
jgi:hypothetical protein